MNAPALLLLVPVFDDWGAADLLLRRLDDVLRGAGLSPDVLFVDDGSTTLAPAMFPAELQAIRSVSILRLRRNLGHQRAIAIGLAWVHENTACTAVLVMDGDGEDDPLDVPRLHDRMKSTSSRKIIFAERTRRSETMTFRVFYQLYRLVHRVLTGIGVRVGNFSIVPRGALASLMVVSELWNHYAAAVFKARIPFETLPTERGRRLSGQSSMNFIALVVHGLSAVSVFGEIVGVRLLMTAFVLSATVVGALGATIGVRFATDMAIPGWATYTTGLLVILLTQVVMLACMFVFMSLGARANVTFLPIRDYAFFVAGISELRRRDG